MKIKSIAINCTNRGCAYAVTTRSGAAGLTDSVSGGGHYPKLSVLINLAPRTDGCSNTLTTILKDNLIMGLQQQLSTLEYHEHPTTEQLVDFFKPMAYIRKATPREYFRLMGLTDADIDKIDSYPCASVQEFANADKATQRQGIAKTNKYKLAGNSIVVDVLYAIFENMFINDCTTEPQQLTLDLYGGRQD